MNAWQGAGELEAIKGQWLGGGRATLTQSEQ